MNDRITPLIIALCITVGGFAQTVANFQAFNSPDTIDAMGMAISGLSLQTADTDFETLLLQADRTPAAQQTGVADDALLSATNPVVSKPFYPMGMMHCAAGPTPVQEVINPVTGQVWMDRNLGAKRDAADSYDPYAFGDLYQWGRFADGHQCRTSAVSKKTAISSIPNPDEDGFGQFILPQKITFDWLLDENTSLWQETVGANNPCPFGYRVPTEAELAAEMNTWASADASGAIASPLKWPLAGYRYNKDGDIYEIGALGSYWSSTIDGTSARYLFFDEAHADISTYYRANGHSVRCIKD